MQLCSDLARQARRLRYVRQSVNRGGAATFNAVFALRHPGARYSTWAAGDDTHDDEAGRHLRSWGDQGLPGADPDVSVRFAALSQRTYQC